MAGLANKVKLTVLKGMEVVGQSASNLASNAQHKLQELNLETQRREILSDFPLRAYDLWQKGEALPEPLDKMLKELSELDERLGVLRAQRYAKVEAASAEQAEDGDQSADGEAASDTSLIEDGEKADQADAVSDQQEPYAPGEAGADEQPIAPQPENPAPMDEGETGDNA